MAEKFLVAVLLRTRDRMRKEVWGVYGILIGMARSELEDEIEQFIDSSMFDNIGGDFVCLESRPTR